MMKTMRWRIDSQRPDQGLIAQAAALLKSGQLVAFPTETVYGLGADAYNPEAVKKVFEVKGRPPQSPLLVHVSNLEQVYGLTAEFSPLARLLMDRFWPGPLAFILPASARVPAVVLGGKKSVGLRMPSHPVALALIEQAGPIAAPSANLSGRPSPVSAEHVMDDLDGRIAAILDAGSTGFGLESTILDISREKPELVRQGGLPLEELEAVLGFSLETATASRPRPAFKTGSLKIELCQDLKQLQELIPACEPNNTALVHYGQNPLEGMAYKIKAYTLDLKGQGGGLYAIMREAESQGLKRLIFAPLPENLTGLSRSLADRSIRAAGGG